MKNVIIAGLIAGFASGIVAVLLNISGLWELFSILPFILPVDIQTLVLSNIIHGTIWGIIFSVLYAFFYDYIPGKEVKKGLVYGLMIWIIAPIHNAGVAAMYGYSYAIPYALVTFFSMVIVYGLLIGYLYKKK